MSTFQTSNFTLSPFFSFPNLRREPNHEFAKHRTKLCNRKIDSCSKPFNKGIEKALIANYLEMATQYLIGNKI